MVFLWIVGLVGLLNCCGMKYFLGFFVISFLVFWIVFFMFFVGLVRISFVFSVLSILCCFRFIDVGMVRISL